VFNVESAALQRTPAGNSKFFEFNQKGVFTMAIKLESKRAKGDSGSYLASDGISIAGYDKYVRYETMIQSRKLGMGKVWMWLSIVVFIIVIVWLL
jgi:hypothetical protein